jgi:hypothetical protein
MSNRQAAVQIEILSQKPPSLRLTLSGDEIKYLRLALERATFVDTPPLDQKAIYNFAADLLRNLETL